MTTQQVEWMNQSDTDALLDGITLDTSTGFGVPPYRHIKGTLANLRSRYHTTQGGNSMLIIQLQIGGPGFEMVSCTQPWSQPNCELEATVFDPTQIRENSPAGVLLSSAKKCMGNEANLKLSSLKGKMVEIMYTQGHMVNTRITAKTDTTPAVYDDVPTLAFEFISVDGRANPEAHPRWDEGVAVPVTELAAVAGGSNGVAVASPVTEEMLLAMIDGKTVLAFKREMMANPDVQADKALYDSVISDTVTVTINNWVTEGKVVRQGEGNDATFVVIK